MILGGIGLDMCKSPSRAASLVANIHSGNINLVKDGISVNPRRIDAYVATMDTESTIRVVDILTQLGIPQVIFETKHAEMSFMSASSHTEGWRVSSRGISIERNLEHICMFQDGCLKSHFKIGTTCIDWKAYLLISCPGHSYTVCHMTATNKLHCIFVKKQK